MAPGARVADAEIKRPVGVVPFVEGGYFLSGEDRRRRVLGAALSVVCNIVIDFSPVGIFLFPPEKQLLTYVRTDISRRDLSATSCRAASPVRRWAAAGQRAVGGEEPRTQGEQGDTVRCCAVCGVE